ncbi:MAG: DUF2281 domain-containing protein [Drouetiella hepatica Uher 2000/2452]|jgi:hypothetical protein|uniref:DUF2281 domain-containing protein n=1 Tax=Drouetiella hepatica Uher 2000/2452 TaxID=904376 RepID=A0A951QB51_9CYAN|nr:DUF2281 domain-containing protein [Drouetiella hepatica Uher 2000/2452]
MQPIQQQIIEILQTLPSIEQQKVLDFAEFLQSKQQISQPEPEKPISVLELAGDLIGSLQGGPSDLSTNKKYMEGFGEE